MGRDLTLNLSDEEKRLIADSVEVSARKPGLNRAECEHFLDTWGNELETMGSAAAIAVLGGLSLPRMRSFLRAADIPEHCLEAILRFSVEDFEGVEDLELISTEIIEPDQIRIEYFFQLQTLVWTVEVSKDDYHQHGHDFREHFINVRVEDGAASMELVQRCYFKAVTVFDRDRAEFSDVSITSSAIRPPRSTRQRSRSRQVAAG